jgi:DnaJ-class molecular chaperone
MDTNMTPEEEQVAVQLATLIAFGEPCNLCFGLGHWGDWTTGCPKCRGLGKVEPKGT